MLNAIIASGRPRIRVSLMAEPFDTKISVFRTRFHKDAVRFPLRRNREVVSNSGHDGFREFTREGGLTSIPLPGAQTKFILPPPLFPIAPAPSQFVRHPAQNKCG